MKLNLKSNGLVNLEEEILRLLSIQAVAQLLLTCFSQVYSENWNQKLKQKDQTTAKTMLFVR